MSRQITQSDLDAAIRDYFAGSAPEPPSLGSVLHALPEGLVAPRQAALPLRKQARLAIGGLVVLLAMAVVVLPLALSQQAGVPRQTAEPSGVPVGAIAVVNGEVITPDAVRDRVRLLAALDGRRQQDYMTMRNQGILETNDFTALQAELVSNQDQSTVTRAALDQLIAEAEIRQYAEQNGFSVGDQQVSDQIKADGTSPAMRHVRIIAVASQPSGAAGSPSAADLSAAEAAAKGYLAEIQAGTAWDTVAAESRSNVTNSLGSVGDLGPVTRASLNVETDLADAIFALPGPNDVTAVFKGSDGVYRFAMVTSIVPEYVDSDWETQVAGASSQDLYRAYAKEEATTKAVQSAVEARYIGVPTDQRHVLEIAVGPGYAGSGAGDQVKIRVLVFSPNHNQTGASNVAPTDPAWAAAKDRADAAVAALRSDPSRWDSMAADAIVNDDMHWNMSGGSIPWLPREFFQAQTRDGATGLGVANVEAAVFADGVTPGTILDPIEEPNEGYYVVQFQGRRAAPEQRIAGALLEINAGTDFAAEAAKVSEAADAQSGADLGWVSRYMVDAAQWGAISSTSVGHVTGIVTDSGYYLFKVVDEQTRTADAAQQALLKRVVFTNWLVELQSSAKVNKDEVQLSQIAPTPPIEAIPAPTAP